MPRSRSTRNISDRVTPSFAAKRSISRRSSTASRRAGGARASIFIEGCTFMACRDGCDHRRG
jgi:hypothetical protein